MVYDHNPINVKNPFFMTRENIICKREEIYGLSSLAWILKFSISTTKQKMLLMGLSNSDLHWHPCVHNNQTNWPWFWHDVLTLPIENFIGHIYISLSPSSSPPPKLVMNHKVDAVSTKFTIVTWLVNGKLLYFSA
jgi:hypothetical protein